jgi:hypothetical protein
VTSPLLNQTHGPIDNDGLTSDTEINKNEHDDLLSDANDVTIHQTSFTSDHTSMISNHTPFNNSTEDFRIRSKSDGHNLKDLASKYSSDNKSLR